VSRGAVLLAATVAALGASTASTERAAPRVAGGGRDRRPRPQRYFGGKAGRKLTRRLRMQEGRNP